MKKVIYDPVFDQIKWIHVAGMDILRKEPYSTEYEALGSVFDPNGECFCYKIMVDSSIFCMERFTKEKIMFLNEQKQVLNLSKYFYEVFDKPRPLDYGLIIFPFTPTFYNYKFIFEK